VVALTKRHRIEGLAHHALIASAATVPREAREAIHGHARTIAAQNLRQAAASVRIAQSLTEAGIDFLFVKGTTLAMLAYDSLAFKQARDIDLLVGPDQALQAAAVLEQAGFHRAYPTQPLSEREFVSWMTHCKESLWRDETSTLVELHTGLVDNPGLLAGITARSARQDVPIGSGRHLPTLARNELFAYLCVHGATHGWSRLKWLADVAAFVSRESEIALIDMFRSAEQLGAGRSAAQALLLAHQLLRLEIPVDLRVELERDGRNRWLTSIAMRAMAGGGAAELDDSIFGTVGINVSHFLLGRGIRFKAGELGRKLSLAEDRVVFPLPRALAFLYPVLALPLWLWRRHRVGRA